MADHACSRRGAAIWLAGVAAIAVSVLHRSSLASAGLVATSRFHLTAASLATFVTYQLLVYTLLQVPAGLMVDRYGPRRILLTAMTVLSVAGTIFAFVDTYRDAVLVRIATGAGDAMVMVAVIRLVAAWASPAWVGPATILTGVLGQVGAIAAAFLDSLLSSFGWTTTYLLVALSSILVGLFAFVVVEDQPPGGRSERKHTSLAGTIENLRMAWAEPATRLGMSIHFSTQFSVTTLATLWGFPFFVSAEGRSPAEASLLLALMLVALMCAGPVIAYLVARHPWHRSSVAIAVVMSIAFVWTVTLLWPGPAPLWLLICLVAVTGSGGPAALIGFDVARSGNRPELLGTANGIVNQGGFLATLTLVVVVGLILDATTTGPSDWSLPAFRLALSFQYLLWGFGLVQILRLRRLTRRLRPRKGIAPVPG